MVISEVQHTIDSLEQAIPMAFIFVLDTTDRSFIYKSFGRHDCVDEIVKIDQHHGIDKLMRDLLFLVHEENNDRLILKKIETNSFLGVCLFHKEYNDEILLKVKEILMK